MHVVPADNVWRKRTAPRHIGKSVLLDYVQRHGTHGRVGYSQYRAALAHGGETLWIRRCHTGGHAHPRLFTTARGDVSETDMIQRSVATC